MLTVCPKCALTLAVTPEDLRVAQGYVRCGRCLNVFNALARLSEERPAAGKPLPSQTPQRPAPEPEPAHREAEPSTGPIEFVLQATLLSGDAAHRPGEERAAAQPAATAPEAHPPLHPVAADREPSAPPAGDPMAQAQPGAAQRELVAAPEVDLLFACPARPGRPPIGWTIGAAALALALALQIVNHCRDQLATDPRLRRPLTTAYAALGISLVPRWNVRPYDVRQFGATLTGTRPAQLLVRASIKNSGREPLPMPLLRVVLQNRFGINIAARDVPPRAYLPASVPAAAFLPAGRRIDATVALVDPDPRARGFEIDACLARSGGRIACAHSP